MADFLNVSYQAVADSFDRLEIKKEISGPLNVSSYVRDANKGINYEVWFCKQCKKNVYINPWRFPREEIEP